MWSPHSIPSMPSKEVSQSKVSYEVWKAVACWCFGVFGEPIYSSICNWFESNYATEWKRHLQFLGMFPTRIESRSKAFRTKLSWAVLALERLGPLSWYTKFSERQKSDICGKWWEGCEQENVLSRQESLFSLCTQLGSDLREHLSLLHSHNWSNHNLWRFMSFSSS